MGIDWDRYRPGMGVNDYANGMSVFSAFAIPVDRPRHRRLCGAGSTQPALVQQALQLPDK